MSSTNATDPQDATDAAATTDPVAWRVLDELLALGGRPFVEEVLGIFLSDTPRRLVALRDACAQGDLVAVRQVAHALAGGGGQIGAESFSSLARTVEEQAVRGDRAALEGAVPRLDALGGVVLGALTDWLASSPRDAGPP